MRRASMPQRVERPERRLRAAVAAASRDLPLSAYPESDGEPMAETPVHWQATVDAKQPLVDFFRQRPDVYVGSDMMMYYRKNDRSRCVAPDVFVAFGVPKLPERRSWFRWLEGDRGPDFVLEVTSKKTRTQDEVRKKALYRSLGVREYWQFDPTGDYLDPILKCQVLGRDERYRQLVLEERDGMPWASSLLGLELHLQGGRLRFFDPDRNGYLPTKDEEAEARQAAEETRDREIQARIAAEETRDRETQARQAEVRVREAAEAARDRETQARLAAEETRDRETQARLAAEETRDRETQARQAAEEALRRETLARQALEAQIAELKGRPVGNPR